MSCEDRTETFSEVQILEKKCVFYAVFLRKLYAACAPPKQESKPRKIKMSGSGTRRCLG